MNYATVDFMEVRRLVLQQELKPGPIIRLDDSSLFQSSNQVDRAKLAICNLRERAKVINHILSLAPCLKDFPVRNFSDEGSIWFDEALTSELLCLIPIAVARCPDLLPPEILVNAVLTTKYAGALLKECLKYIPILRRPYIELLADIISKLAQRERAGTYVHISPLLGHCLQQSYSAMEAFCLSDPRIASVLREDLVQRCICSDMIIQITVDILKDVVDFMTSILLSGDETSRWIVSCIRSTKRAKEICSTSDVEKLDKLTGPLTSTHSIDALELKESTVLELRKALREGAEVAFNEDGWTCNLYCHLKLYCLLVHLGGLKPVQEEMMFWLRALTCTAESCGSNEKHPGRNNITSERRFELGVTFLFLIPGFRGTQLTENLSRECLLFFLGPAIYGRPPFEQGLKISLWLVIQLLLQNYAQVCEYCSKAIGMNIRIGSTCWEDLLRLGHETGITSAAKSIAKAASSLRPTGPISSTNRCDKLVIESLFQLLKSGHLVQNRVDISEAIMHCILLSVEPIHPMMVQMIEIFAEASCTPTSINASDAFEMHPLPLNFLYLAVRPFCACPMFLESASEEEIAGGSTGARISPSNFIGTESAAIAVLASFYILCREKYQRNRGASLGNCSYSSTGTNDEGILWSKILRFLPLDKLLAHMESCLHSYEHIFAQWVGLAISLFPKHLHFSDLVQRLEGSEGDSFAKQGKVYQFEEQFGMHDEDLKHVFKKARKEGEVNNFVRDFSIELAREVMRNSSVNGKPASKLLKAFHGLNISAKDKLELQIAVIEDLVPLLLDKSCSDSLQEAFCEWWYSLDQASVELLVPLFCRYVKNSDVDVNEGTIPSTNDARLLSAPNWYQELVEQPLSILTCRREIYSTPLISVLLDILKELLRRNRQMCLMASTNDGEKKEEILRAVDTRDSAVCRILLENWSRMSSLDVTRESVLKAGSVICAFISSLFYSRPSVFRVVHIQGYDMKLIPAVVKGVTLTIHFLAFFEESLKFVELPILPFIVLLLSNVIRKHPTHSRSLPAARKAVMHIRNIDLEMVIDFSMEILEPMAWFAVTFPLLEPDVREFLEGCLTAINSRKSTGVDVEGLCYPALSALRLLNKDDGDGT